MKPEDHGAEHYVYRIMDADDVVLYVGMTWDLNGRLEAHQGRPWAWRIRRVDVTRHAGRAAAMEVERAEIVRLLPLYNVNIKRLAEAAAKSTSGGVKAPLTSPAQSTAHATVAAPPLETP